MRDWYGFSGSRDFPDTDKVIEVVASLPKDSTVVSGGRGAVDNTAEQTAKDLGMRVVSFRPVEMMVGGFEGFAIKRVTWHDGHWEDHLMRDGEGEPLWYPTFGPAAYVRNTFIVEASTKLFVFWNGHSNGTKNTMDYAHKEGVPVEMVRA